MKRMLRGFGMALLYLALYLALQVGVSAVCGGALALWVVLREGPEQLGSVGSLLMSHMAGMVLLSNAMFILTLWLVLRCQKKELTAETKLLPIRRGNLLACLLVGVSMPFAVSALMGLLPFPDSVLEEFGAQQGLLFAGNPVPGFVSIVLVGPLAEELLFRGMIYNSLKSGLRPWVAGLLAALLFGVCHGQSFWILAAFLMGLVMVWCYEKTGSLWGSLAIHAVNNGIAFAETYLPQPDPVVGGILTLALLAVLLGALFYLWKSNRKTPIES